MLKRKLLVIIIIGLFMLQVFLPQNITTSQSTVAKSRNMDLDSTSQLGESPQINSISQPGESPQINSISQPGESPQINSISQPGESVKIQIATNHAAEYIESSNSTISLTYTSDNNYYYDETTSPVTTTTGITYNYSFYDVVFTVNLMHSGELTVKGFAGAIFGSDYYSTSSSTISLAVDTAHIAQNEFKFCFGTLFYYDGGLPEVANLYHVIKIWDPINLVWEIVYYSGAKDLTASTSPLNHRPDTLTIDVDYISFAEQYIFATQSTSQYVENDIFEHKLFFDNFAYNSKITVYAPLSWNLTRITPDADFVYDYSNEYWKITNTVPVTYEFMFLSGSGYGVDYAREPQILAIDNLFSNSFDWSFNSWTNANGGSATFSSVSLSAANNFDGVQSLRAESTSAGSHYLMTNQFDIGEFYFSFSIYVESGTLNYGYWDGTTDQKITITPTLNRWQTIYGFIHIGSKTHSYGTGYYNFFIELVGTGVFYFDYFKTYTANSKIDTVGYNQYSFSATFNYWTPYGLFPAVGVDSNLELRDRTANEKVQSWSGTTDSTGDFSVSYNSALEQKEYELRAYSVDSYFLYRNSKTNIDSLNAGNWKMNSVSAYTITQFDRTTIKVEASDTDSNWLYLTYTDFLDLSDHFYLSFSLKTDSGSENFDKLYVGSSLSTNYQYILYSFDDTTAYQSYVFSDEDFVTNGDDTSFDKYFQLRNNGAGSYVLYLQNLHFTQSQKTYFTPQSADATVLSINFVFSQDTFTHSHDQNYITSINGYLNYSASYSGAWGRIQYDPAFQNTYSSLSLRYKVSSLISADMVRIRFIAYEQLSPAIYLDPAIITTISDDGEWHTLYVDFPIGYLSNLYTYPMNSTHSSTPYLMQNDTILFDYFRFYNQILTDLYETSSSFVLSSENNSLSYAVWSDNTFLGYYSDLEYIEKDLSVGTHNFTYVPIYNEQTENVQVPGTPVSYYYTVVEEGYSVQIWDFSLSSSTVNTFVSGTRSGTYEVYENNTLVAVGSYAATGTSISHTRDTTPGLIQLSYKFMNGTDTRWFNTSYSNAAEITTVYSVQIWDFSLSSSTVNTFVSGTRSGTYEVYENNTLVAVGSYAATGTSISHTRDTTPGLIQLSYKFMNGTDTRWFNTSYSNAAEITTYDISIDVFDGLGIGIPFETIQFYANYSGKWMRVPQQFQWQDENITLVATDFFGVQVFYMSYNLTNELTNYLRVEIGIYDISIQNPYDVGVSVQITRNSHTFFAAIPSNDSISFRLLPGIYEISVSPIYDDPTFSDQYIGNEPIVAYRGSHTEFTMTSTMRRYQIFLQPTEQTPTTSEPTFFEKLANSKSLSMILLFAGIIGALRLGNAMRSNVQKYGYKGIFKFFGGE